MSVFYTHTLTSCLLAILRHATLVSSGAFLVLTAFALESMATGQDSAFRRNKDILIWAFLSSFALCKILSGPHIQSVSWEAAPTSHTSSHVCYRHLQDQKIFEDPIGRHCWHATNSCNTYRGRIVWPWTLLIQFPKAVNSFSNALACLVVIKQALLQGEKIKLAEKKVCPVMELWLDVGEVIQWCYRRPLLTHFQQNGYEQWAVPPCTPRKLVSS